MPSGTVKFFNAKKGFGFIATDEGTQEIFLPAASLTASGISNVLAGQRVTFETQPDVKGPKAINLVLVGSPPVQAPAPVRPVQPHAPQAPRLEKPRVTLYHDPDSDASCDALDDLREAGIEPRIVEYLTTPLTVNELRSLSLLLRENDQSLVKKYDTLFLELQLDDRFISENEFWGAIVEHPTLINGPVIATQNKAAVCKTEQAVQSFIASLSTNSAPPAPQAKGLSARLMQLVNGTAAPRPMAPVAPVVEEDVEEKPLAKAGERKILETVTAQPEREEDDEEFEDDEEDDDEEEEEIEEVVVKPTASGRARLTVKSKSEPKLEAKAKAKPAAKAPAKKPAAAAKPVKKPAKKK